MKIYPDKDKAFPNPAIPSLCYIKNVVKNPRIIIGDYTYLLLSDKTQIAQ